MERRAAIIRFRKRPVCRGHLRCNAPLRFSVGPRVSTHLGPAAPCRAARTGPPRRRLLVRCRSNLARASLARWLDARPWTGLLQSMRLSFALSAACLLVVAGVACGSSDGKSSWVPSDGGVGGSNSGAGGNAGQGASGGWSGSGGAQSSEPCKLYIECVSQTTPAGLDAVLAAYGKNGSCWDEGDASLCENACRAGTIAANKAFGAEACNYCDTPADCPSSKPGCDSAAHRCVECSSDADCKQQGKRACNVSSHVCVACTSDAHCANSASPRCDTAVATCVQCLDNADCAMTGSPVCDVSTHHCRNCQTDAECSPGVCNNGYCSQCKSNSDCPSNKPVCSPQSICVGCQQDSDCNGGVCNTLMGKCCGATACADSAAECGWAVDPVCPLFPIDCASCASGNWCVDSKCEPAPVKTCSDSTCSGDCGFVPEKKAYECINHYSSCTKTTPCDPGYKCVEMQSQVTYEWYWTCVRYCLTDADCPGGTCKPQSGPSTVGTCE